MRSATMMAAVFSLWTGLLLAAAPTTTTTTRDSTTFKVRTAAGQLETVTVEDLAVGETRSVQTTGGTPVVVGRHERGYVLDVAGERIEVSTPAVHLDTEGDPLVIHSGAGTQVVVQMDKTGEVADGAQTEVRKVVIVKKGAQGDVITTGADAEVLLEQLEGADPALADGKRVMVVRKVEKRRETTTPD